MRQKRVCYAYKSRKGTLKLIESVRHLGCWDLFLDENLVRSEYQDPWQAADEASRSDFGDETLDRLLVHEAIPADLDRWQKSLRWL
jgi:hypothetical protein